MDSDTNRFDAEHATTAHPRMSAQELESIYRQAWQLFTLQSLYSDLATASDIADCDEGLVIPADRRGAPGYGPSQDTRGINARMRERSSRFAPITD